MPSDEMMLMKAASLTLQAPVDQGFGIRMQQPVRVIQGVVTGFERLGTSKDETRYAVALEPRLALLSRSDQNAIYQDMSFPQIVKKSCASATACAARIFCSRSRESIRAVSR